MLHLDDKERESKLALLIFSHLKVYFQYHMKCQHIAYNEGDNRISRIQLSEMIVLASKMVHLDENGQEFNLGLQTQCHWKCTFNIT